MKNSISKFTFSQLQEDDSFDIIDRDELQYLSGGVVNGCVFDVFNYLDGSANSSNYYYYGTMYYLGYDAVTNGGVNNWDIAKVGNMGGMSVTQLGGVTMRDINSGRLMGTFNSVGGTSHAVIYHNWI